MKTLNNHEVARISGGLTGLEFFLLSSVGGAVIGSIGSAYVGSFHRYGGYFGGSDSSFGLVFGAPVGFLNGVIAAGVGVALGATTTFGACALSSCIAGFTTMSTFGLLNR